jgi:iron(III) transport system ATP-binding protein
MRDLKPDEMADRVSDVLKIVRMDGYEARSPNQLSGGQQQRIALARAIVIRPDILLLDEPLSNLDAKLRLEMRDEIKRIQNETAITTIYVTHDQKEALSMGNSIAVMKDGKIVQRDDPRVVHRSPADSFVASFIGETNFFHGKVVSLEEGKARVQLNDLEEAILVSKRIYEGLELGETVIISIRPECIHFEESVTPNEDYNKVMCTVEESTYLGELEQYSLRLKEHTDSIKSIHLNPFMIRKAGTKEKVYIHPNDVVLLKK